VESWRGTLSAWKLAGYLASQRIAERTKAGPGPSPTGVQQAQGARLVESVTKRVNRLLGEP